MFRLQTHRVSGDHLGGLALADVVGLHSALAVHHQVQDENVLAQRSESHLGGDI